MENKLSYEVEYNVTELERGQPVMAIPVLTKTMEPIPGLRKAKAKAMAYAVIHSVYDKDNHFITYYSGIFHFYYRGTLIYKWDAFKDAGENVNAGAYENTPSTMNQRKEIKKAIDNFREVVMKTT